MASLKDVRVKIAGIRKTKQITKAMHMVASAKMRGAQNRIQRFRGYADSFQELLRDIAAAMQGEDNPHPLLAPRSRVERVGILLSTSDRGLCGGFNINLISAAAKLAKQKQAEGKDVHFYCVGRKGRDAVRKMGFPVTDASAGATGLDFHLADRLGDEIISGFLRADTDEIYLIYGAFAGMLRQEPTTVPLLPLKAEQGETNASRPEYICEPTGNALMDALLPRVIKALVYRGLLDTTASEHAARMTAMDNATRNCDELIETLTRLFNKTRQAAITTDLIDIVGGVEAMKG